MSLEQNHNGLFHEVSGLFVSGEVGAGKSTFLRELIHEGIDSEELAINVLDPGNDLAEDVFRDLAARSPDVVDRTMYFFPGNPSLPIGPIDPLHVANADALTPHEYEARLNCRVMHTAHILLNSMGQDSFDGMAQLYLLVTLILRSLAQLGMPVTEAWEFFDVGGDLYNLLTSVVPSRMARTEFARLRALKVDRQEELIGSTKRRFYALLSDPIVAAHLGSVGTTLDFKQLLKNRSICIWNLSLGNEYLSLEGQSMLANVILSEIFLAQLTMPRDQRVPSLTFADELSLFRASAPLISRSLRLTRKTLGRFVGATQGITAFPEPNDPMLKSILAACNTVVLRHSVPEDAEAFGQMLSMFQRRSDRVKFEHEEEQQYVDHNELVTLISRNYQRVYGEQSGSGGSKGQQHSTNSDVSVSSDQSQQRSKATAKTRTRGRGNAINESNFEGLSDADQFNEIGQLYRNAVTQVAGISTGRSANENEAESDQHSINVGNGLRRGVARKNGKSDSWGFDLSWSSAKNSQVSEGVSFTPQLIPVYRWRKIIRLELMTFAEQDAEQATLITQLQRGEAFAYIKGTGVVRLEIRMRPDPFERFPDLAPAAVESFLQQVLANPLYVTVEQLHADRIKVKQIFMRDVSAYLASLPQPITLQGLGAANVPLAMPDNGDLHDDGVTI